MHVLMVGYNDLILRGMEAAGWPARSVTILEEEGVWRGRGLDAKASQRPSIRTVLFGDYQQSDGFLSVAAQIEDVHAVAPGIEYAVVPAARLAEERELPGAGVKAAEVLRNKLRLRQVTTAAGMAAPQYEEVSGPDDVATFATGRAVVLKPAERQASLGVLRLGPGDDPGRAWLECTGADEGARVAQREMQWVYMVEELLQGPEYSTEVLVRGGVPLFVNVTAKRTSGGRYPVELGHVVPGAAPDSPQWMSVVRQLIDAVGFDSGILHGEWIVDDRGPVLIECAGRPPGDRIVDLVNNAYGINLADSWMRLLAGDVGLHPPRHPRRGAAVRFVTSGPGRIEDIRGLDLARCSPGVFGIDILRGPGDVVGALTSSWDRVGLVLARGGDAADAEERAAVAAGHVQVLTT